MTGQLEVSRVESFVALAPHQLLASRVESFVVMAHTGGLVGRVESFAALSQLSARVGRVESFAALVPTTPTTPPTAAPPTRSASIVSETLVAGSSGVFPHRAIGASQVVLEALVATPGAPLHRASQVTIETLYATLIASQVVLEALVWIFPMPTPPVYPTLIGLAFSVVRRPMFYTAAARSGSGWSVRVSYSSTPTWEWDLTYEYLPDYPSQSSSSDIRTLLGFFLAMQGDVTPFLFRDPDDSSVVGQVLGTTDGSSTTWTLVRSYGIGEVGTEPIGYADLSRPVSVYLDGVLQSSGSYNIVTLTPVSQLLVFQTVPPSGRLITIDFSYFFYVKFKDGSNDFEKFMDRLWSVKKVTLESLRG